MFRTWQHSPGRLQPGLPDQRPELSPDAFCGACEADGSSLTCLLSLIFQWPAIGVAIYPPLLNPEEDGPSFSLLLVTPHLPNPWETR